MIIAIDVDGVLCNTQEHVTNLFNLRYGSSYTLDAFQHYDIASDLDVEEANIMKAIYGEDHLYWSMRPIKGAVEALRKMLNDGHQVYIVTDAIPATYNEKVQWIQHYFPFIDDAHIVSMRHKWLFKCDVMIDDCLENILGGGLYERIVLDYPWNRDVRDDVYDIYRCFDWNDISKTVDVINEKYKEWNNI